MAKYKLEYLWLDGYEPVANLRGKTQIKEFASFPKLEELPWWGFDGSSTRQAEGKSSDCMLKPVAVYPDSTKKNGVLVMCEVYMPDKKTPHPSNSRATILDDSDAEELVDRMIEVPSRVTEGTEAAIGAMSVGAAVGGDDRSSAAVDAGADIGSSSWLTKTGLPFQFHCGRSPVQPRFHRLDGTLGGEQDEVFLISGLEQRSALCVIAKRVLFLDVLGKLEAERVHQIVEIRMADAVNLRSGARCDDYEVIIAIQPRLHLVRSAQHVD